MTQAGGHQRLARRYPFGLAVLILALFFWLSLNIMLDGFPDGYISDLGRAEHRLIDIFDSISLAMAAWCVLLGVAAGRLNVRTIL
jgi:uncharacterized membrane protein